MVQQDHLQSARPRLDLHCCNALTGYLRRSADPKETLTSSAPRCVANRCSPARVRTSSTSTTPSAALARSSARGTGREHRDGRLVHAAGQRVHILVRRGAVSLHEAESVACGVYIAKIGASALSTGALRTGEAVTACSQYPQLGAWQERHAP
jgi:hypothetical protein